MNFQKISQELVTALRGKLSQAQLSTRLGFAFNKVHRWESGRTAVSWLDFVDLCQHRRTPLIRSLREAYSYSEDARNTSSLLRHFVAKSTLKPVTDGTGFSRYSLSRMLSGNSSPTLAQVLAIMCYASADFFRFLELLVPTDLLPAVREQIRQDRVQLDLFARYPWLSALLSAIDLQVYRDQPSDNVLPET